MACSSDHDPKEFGITGTQLHQIAELRSGGATAETLATEYADSSHLSWTVDLPADDIRAIPILRRLLHEQTDPLTRHFIYDYLEARLYRSLLSIHLGVDEYDQACRQHDAEMDGIREAFISQWGFVPHLDDIPANGDPSAEG